MPDTRSSTIDNTLPLKDRGDSPRISLTGSVTHKPQEYLPYFSSNHCQPTSPCHIWMRSTLSRLGPLPTKELFPARTVLHLVSPRRAPPGKPWHTRRRKTGPNKLQSKLSERRRIGRKERESLQSKRWLNGRHYGQILCFGRRGRPSWWSRLRRRYFQASLCRLSGKGRLRHDFSASRFWPGHVWPNVERVPSGFDARIVELGPPPPRLLNINGCSTSIPWLPCFVFTSVTSCPICGSVRNFNYSPGRGLGRSSFSKRETLQSKSGRLLRRFLSWERVVEIETLPILRNCAMSLRSREPLTSGVVPGPSPTRNGTFPLGVLKEPLDLHIRYPRRTTSSSIFRQFYLYIFFDYVRTGMDDFPKISLSLALNVNRSNYIDMLCSSNPWAVTQKGRPPELRRQSKNNRTEMQLVGRGCAARQCKSIHLKVASMTNPKHRTSSALPIFTVHLYY